MVSCKSTYVWAGYWGSPVNFVSELNSRIEVTGCYKPEKYCSGMVPGGTLIPVR